MPATFLSEIYNIVPVGSPLGSYDYGIDAFGYNVTGMQHNWHSCRDKVQVVLNPSLERGLLFTHNPGMEVHIAAFINKIENIIELRQQTIFQRTDLPKVLRLQLSPFWLSSFMRKSFITLLLRCGARYNSVNDNFQQALQSINYARDTQPAIARFLAGFTHYVGVPTTDMTMGWHRIFLHKNANFARELLKAGNELTEKRAYIKYRHRVENGWAGSPERDWQDAEMELAAE
jgi:hypothetical protein